MKIKRCELCQRSTILGLTTIKNKFNGNKLDICQKCLKDFLPSKEVSDAESDSKTI